MLGTAPGVRTRRRIPPLTAALFVLNLGFFLGTAALGGSEEPAVLALFGAKVVSLVEAGEWWRVVASAFLHIGPLHLVLNAYALYLLGTFVERTYGVRLTLLIYTAGAVGGGVLSTLLSPALSAGASGAIMGLLGVTLLHGYRNRHRLPPRAQRLFWVYLVPFFLISIVLSFLSEIIDNWAHLGGLAGGVLAALPWGNPAEPSAPTRAREWGATTGAIAAGALVAVCLAFALRSAAGASIWAEASMRRVDDPALGVRFDVPLAWREVRGGSDPSEWVFADRLGAAVTVHVRPYVSGAPALEKLVRAELRAVAWQGPQSRLAAGPEDVALAGARATRALLEVADGRARFRRELYFIAARGRAVVLILDAPQAAVALYRAVFAHIAGTLRTADSSLADGWALLAEGKARDAIPRLESALQGPRRVLALRALARAHREVGEIQTSLARAEEASRLSPKSPQVRAELIEALQAAGRTEDAKRILADARRLAKADVRALLGLAETAYEVGLLREAVDLYQEIVAVRRDLYSAYNSLAWILATAKDPTVRDPARAERLARAAVEGHRWKDPAFIDTLAEAQYAAGRPREAVVTAEKALALTPDDDYLKRQLAKFRAASAGRAPGDGGAR